VSRGQRGAVSAEPICVTDHERAASADESRHARLLAEWEAERERREEDRRQNPEAWARIDAIAATLNGDEDEGAAETRSFAYFAKRCALTCSSCRSFFDDGDVVYRLRIETEPDFIAHWELGTYCGRERAVSVRRRLRRARLELLSGLAALGRRRR
jgi:hypothetical protein